MKVNFKHYIIQAIVRMAIAIIPVLSSCDEEADYNAATEGKSGITFSLSVEQDEVTAGQMTRAGGAAGLPIRQMYYRIKRQRGDIWDEFPTHHQFLSPDFSRLTVEGLEAGKYFIFFYATTQEEPKLSPSGDILVNWFGEDKPLNMDLLFGRVDFEVDGLYKVPQEISVRLKRCVGEVNIEIKGFPYLKRLIKSVEIDILDRPKVHSAHWDDYGKYTATMGNIKGVSMHPDSTHFYSFPSSAALSGVVTVHSVLQDGITPTSRTYRFHNALNIEEGKISTIQVDWDSPDNHGVVFVTRPEYTSENSSEVFAPGEPRATIINRRFETDKPLQVKIDNNHKLRLTSYAPVDIKRVKIMCRMKEYSPEYFQVAYYEVYPAWHDSFWEIPLTKRETTYQTESGQLITIPARPALSQADCEFKIVTDDPYMKNIGLITYPMRISFNKGVTTLPPYNVMHQAVSPEIGRQACVLAVNFSALISSPEFERQIRTYKEIPFVTDTNNVQGTLIPPETLISKARAIKKMMLFELHWVEQHPMIPGMADRLSQDSAILALREDIYKGQYRNFPQAYEQYRGPKDTYYHELGHAIGYAHLSSITAYDKKWYAWQNCCLSVFEDLAEKGKLPIRRIDWNLTNYWENNYP